MSHSPFHVNYFPKISHFLFQEPAPLFRPNLLRLQERVPGSSLLLTAFYRVYCQLNLPNLNLCSGHAPRSKSLDDSPLLYELQVYSDQFLAGSPRPDLKLPLQPHIHHLTGVTWILLASILLFSQMSKCYASYFLLFGILVIFSLSLTWWLESKLKLALSGEPKDELRINVSQKEFSAKQGREDTCNYDLARNIINAIKQNYSAILYPEKRDHFWPAK